MTSPEPSSPVSVSSGLRLSPQQARLWSLLDHAPTAPVAGCVLVLEGQLDRERLQRALAALVERHEILRTAYRRLRGTSTGAQVPESALALRFAEAPAAEGGDVQTRLFALIEGLRSARAPLTDSGSLGATLTALGSGQSALVLTLPALSADHRSLAAMARLVAEAYSAEGRGGGMAETLQYADVAEVLNDLLESPGTEAGRRHWREVDLDPLLTRVLSAESSSGRAQVGGAAFALRTLPVPTTPGFTAALRTVASAAGVEPQALVLAAWQALVYRLGARPHWSVAVTFAGRTYEGLEHALGLFERRLPLQLDIDGRTSVVELARAARTQISQASEWQDYFILGRAPGGGNVPYFPLAFTSFDWPEPAEADGLRVSTVAVEAVVDRGDLELCCLQHAHRIEILLRGDTSQHGEAELARIAERFACLLEGVVAQPDAPITSLPILGREEAALIASFNRTERDWPIERCVHELFDEQARRTPDRDAIVYGERRLTYAELSEHAGRLAGHLRSLGVAPAARVALCLERGVELLVGVLGILKAGAAYVPIDPMLPRQRIAYMLAQAGVEIAVTQEPLRDLLAGDPERDEGSAGEPSSAPLRVVTLDGDAATISKAPVTSALAGEISPGSLAYVIFTSGSTGRPKGVMIPHRSVVNLAAALREAVYAEHGEGLRVSLSAPLAFDASVKQWVQLLAGHTLHVIPEEARPDAAQLCEVVRRCRLDVLDCTPSQLAGMLERGLGHAPDLSPALVLVGGEAIDDACWNALRAAPRTTFVNVYGPTECTVDATACAVRESPRPTIGRPLGNIRVHVLDGAMRAAPIGVAGELYIGGAGVGSGYASNPSLTAERFVQDPVGPAGARLYRTGDLARLRDDGTIEFVGRADGQVKIRGMRIELGEIEVALKEQPEVREAVVMPVEVSPGQVHLVGYVVPRDDGGAAPDKPAALRAALRRSLPEYMVPWALIPLTALPLTSNGKLDRAALPHPSVALADEVSYEPPTSEIERTIATIWQDVLGVPRVGLHHNFFDLGGHSLLMVRVHERLKAAFHLELSMVEVFRYPTVAALAKYIAGAGEDTDTGRGNQADRAQKQRLAMEKQAERNKARRTSKQ